MKAKTLRRLEKNAYGFRINPVRYEINKGITIQSKGLFSVDAVLENGDRIELMSGLTKWEVKEL